MAIAVVVNMTQASGRLHFGTCHDIPGCERHQMAPVPLADHLEVVVCLTMFCCAAGWLQQLLPFWLALHELLAAFAAAPAGCSPNLHTCLAHVLAVCSKYAQHQCNILDSQSSSAASEFAVCSQGSALFTSASWKSFCASATSP